MKKESKSNPKEDNYIEGLLTQRLSQINSERRSFHMPGHKNGRLKTFDNVWALDVTEIEGTDDLFCDRDVIAAVHNKINQVYCGGIEARHVMTSNHQDWGNEYRTRMLVGGSSAGIKAALMAVVAPGEAFLVARNCHKSVYNSLLLGDVVGQYIYPEYDVNYHLFTALIPNHVEEAFVQNPNLKGLIMTSPTYEGVFSDIKAIAEIVHRYGGVLIVDEAHGAHLTFSEQLPDSALNLGADIVIQSTHKTLPALTQSALIHYNAASVDESRLLQGLAIHQTSSPSYGLMASIEGAVDYMWTHRKAYDQWVEQLIQLRERSWKHFTLVSNQELIYDPTRFTIYIRHPGITGTQLLNRLREGYGLDFECAGIRTVVAIVTLADSIDDIGKMLEQVASCLDEMIESEQLVGSEEMMGAGEVLNSDVIITSEENHQDRILEQSFPRTHEQALTMKKAFYMEKQGVLLEKAVGCIAAESVIPYPPGIPLLVPGEKISVEHIHFLRRLLSVNLEIYGIIKEEIQVIKE